MILFGNLPSEALMRRLSNSRRGWAPSQIHNGWENRNDFFKKENFSIFFFPENFFQKIFNRPLSPRSLFFNQDPID